MDAEKKFEKEWGSKASRHQKEEPYIGDSRRTRPELVAIYRVEKRQMAHVRNDTWEANIAELKATLGARGVPYELLGITHNRRGHAPGAEVVDGKFQIYLHNVTSLGTLHATPLVVHELCDGAFILEMSSVHRSVHTSFIEKAMFEVHADEATGERLYFRLDTAHERLTVTPLRSQSDISRALRDADAAEQQHAKREERRRVQ